jgi:uncharacterized protein (DUF2384 family)
MILNDDFDSTKNTPLIMVSEPTSIYYLNKPSFSGLTVLDNLAENSRNLFNTVLSKTNLTIKVLAENIFEITPKTFIKYKNTSTKLPSRIAELAIEVSAVYDLGSDVFGSTEAFNIWLDKENHFFYSKKPSSFLNTSTGIRLIFESLKRIEFGATA